MKLKKLSVSALALSTILLTVGCNSNSDTTTENNTNTEVSTETVENIKNKYADNVEVQAFFKLAEQTDGMLYTDFIDKVKEMDTNNTLTMEKADNDYKLSAPYIYFYKITPASKNTELRIVFSDFSEGDSSAKVDLEEFPTHNQIDHIYLMLHDENVVISYNPTYGTYEANIESVDPLITQDNISKIKDVNAYDEKYLKLQDKMIESRDMTVADIEKLWDHKFTENEAYETQVDYPIESDIFNMIELDNEDENTPELLNVTLNNLNNKTELVSIYRYNTDLSYGYDVADMALSTETTINGSKYNLMFNAEDQASLITKLENIYSIVKK